MASNEQCQSCNRALHQVRRFRFRTGELEVVKCLRCALRHIPMLRRSLIASILVGTLLILLNQGDVMLSGSWTAALLWKAPLTYLVPFLVASWGALSISHER